MTDAREVLAEIQQRAEAHHLAVFGGHTPDDPFFSTANWEDKPHRLVNDLARDSRKLIDALTAVLDLHKPYDYPGLGIDIPGVPERVLCGGGHEDDLGTEYPCSTVNAITTALAVAS